MQARAEREAPCRCYTRGELVWTSSGMRDRLAERGLSYVERAAHDQAAQVPDAT